ncbi:hypothetical protein ABZX77_47425, partial [Streptomyces sp. NPDC004237]|uniref:hypothetical protein n=1 Tax=Streptomyces sp. NPDC004237 TaxID=3154455 RepID=UPI0033A8A202
AEYSLRSFRASPREFPPPAGRCENGLRPFHNVRASGTKRSGIECASGTLVMRVRHFEFLD